MDFSKLRVGDRGRIVALNQGPLGIRQRLLALGVVPGREFVVTRKAPLGDPIELCIKEMSLCLRKEDCQLLQIEPIVLS